MVLATRRTGRSGAENAIPGPDHAGPKQAAARPAAHHRRGGEPDQSRRHCPPWLLASRFRCEAAARLLPCKLRYRHAGQARSCGLGACDPSGKRGPKLVEASAAADSALALLRRDIDPTTDRQAKLAAVQATAAARAAGRGSEDAGYHRSVRHWSAALSACRGRTWVSLTYHRCLMTTDKSSGNFTPRAVHFGLLPWQSDRKCTPSPAAALPPAV